MEVKLEYLGEDKDYPGARLWAVEAIHVTTTRNRRKYTKEELSVAGRSLSFRPLNLNHDPTQQLPFPANATLFMEFDSISNSVKGRFRVVEPHINRMIETNKINTVSIEQLPTKGETCNEVSCEQHGVAFIGLALLESHLLPGDKNADIVKESLSEIRISGNQRTCMECTDFTKCHKCQHKEEADSCMEKCLSAKKAAGIKINDQAIAICMSECGQDNKKECHRLYEKFESYKN